MGFLINVNIKSGSKVQDAMKAFEQLQNCTVLDVDLKCIKALLQYRLSYPLLEGVTVNMSILPHIKDLYQVDVDTIMCVLKSHECFNINKTQIKMRKPDTKSKVVNMEEYRLFVKINGMKNTNGTVVFTQAK